MSSAPSGKYPFRANPQLIAVGDAAKITEVLAKYGPLESTTQKATG